MVEFCFLYGTDERIVDLGQRAARTAWGAVEEHPVGNGRLIVAADRADGVVRMPNGVLGIVSGYVRWIGHEAPPEMAPSDGPISGPSGSAFISHITSDGGWPLGNDWTGSFAACAHDPRRGETFLCNDVLGYLPLFYYQGAHGLLVSTSQYVLARCLGCSVDPAGLLQRITPPYCNYGRRTLLEGVCRLLPGEYIIYGSDGSVRVRLFDDSLCKDVLDEPLDDVARTVWDRIKQEVRLLAGGSKGTAVALSGGWDSRLVLGALASCASNIECYTYGDESLYEVSIARRCAQSVGARHVSRTIGGTYFPDRDALASYVVATESANILTWLSLMGLPEWSDRRCDLMLLGDMCECIDGRNMKSLSSRPARVRSALRGLVGRAESIQAATDATIKQWLDDKVQGLWGALSAQLPHLVPGVRESIPTDDLRQSVEEDIRLSSGRVVRNEPQFVPMYDEVFAWFHKARQLMASQDLLLGSRWRCVSPTMSMDILRLVSRVHPRLRLRRRLMDAIARLPELRVLARIPSAQIPWVGATAPPCVREPIWALRSGLDQAMIRRALRLRDPNTRQRVLRSLDYIKEYRREGAIDRVSTWFSGRWVDGEPYTALARARAAMETWPLINLDISAPANVSLLLDSCMECN